MTGKYSYQTRNVGHFQTADYVVFGITLGLSALIGIGYAIKDRNKKDADAFLLGGRNMHPFPVAMSLLATFISAVTILGSPADVYVYNTMYWWISVGMVITLFGASHIFIPVFYRLQVVSVYEYIEMRFGRVTSFICSILFLFGMLIYMAIVLYAPSLALNAVTGLSLWGSIVAICIVCTAYTALGGMVAVLWADTLQIMIVLIGLLALIIRGSNTLGGIDKAWETADRGGRIVFLDFGLDPRQRYSVWSVVIGGGIFWCTAYGTNQAMVQRALSVSSLSRARLAYWINLPGMAIVLTLSTLLGVVMYAFYSRCDPLYFGLIKSYDQMVPLMMMDVLSDTYGLPGLIISCIFSGSLSTLSSGLNALAAVTLKDFIKTFCCQDLSPVRSSVVSKILVVVFGGITLLLAFGVSRVDALVLQLSIGITSILGGPIFGLFVLGMIFPWANKPGGIVGMICSILLTGWICLGAIITKTSTSIRSPVSVAACNFNLTAPVATATTSSLTTTVVTTVSTAVTTVTTAAKPLTTTSIYDKYEGVQQLYTVSYIWYSGIGMVTTVVVGMIVSIITGVTDPKTVNPKLICPIFDVLCPYLPEKIRKPLRFGVRHGEDDGETNRLENKDNTDTSTTKGQDNLGFEHSRSEYSGTRL